MPVPTVFYIYVWCNRFFFCPGHHVLWSLCSHLQTAGLHDHHEPKVLENAYLMLLDNHFLNCFSVILLGTETGILWLCHWSLFLWCLSTPEDLKLRSVVHGRDNSCLLCVDIHHNSYMCWSVLHMYHQNSSKIPLCSAKGKKAFSTCSSHFIVVSITYGSCIFVYVKPSSKDELSINQRVVILTTFISPMLNPFIYTLRNKQVKHAFNDWVKRILSVSKN